MALLEVRDLSVQLRTPQGTVRVVESLSFSIRTGEILGVVGESGSGKSLMAKSLMRFNPEQTTSYPTGQILFDGVDVLRASDAELARIRARGIALVHQDPVSAFNPVLTVGEQIGEAAQAAERLSWREATDRVVQSLRDAGIPSPERRAKQYPHEYSGGMLQRAMIAMALVRRPRLLVADEPTTALDVTVEAEILDLLVDIRDRFRMGILFITHDLGILARLADRVLVMYAGREVESGTVEQLFYNPTMPYTRDLLASAPTLDKDLSTLVAIPGRPPLPGRRPPGCPYAPRCRHRMDICEAKVPDLIEVEPGHLVACVMPAMSSAAGVSEVSSDGEY